MKTRRSYKDKKKKNKAQSLAKKTLKNELKKEIILKKKINSNKHVKHVANLW